MKMCITGGRNSNQEISLFRDGETCSNFTRNDVYDIQISQSLFFGIA